MPINICSSNTDRFGGRIVNHGIFGTLEQMLSHLEKHLLMSIFLIDYSGGEFLNIK